MLFSATIAFALAAVNVLSSPLTERDTPGIVLICKDINFSGSCTKVHFTSRACTALPDGYPGAISSIGPDSGISCNLYPNGGCIPNYYPESDPNHGVLLNVVYPGYTDLRTVNYNDKAASMICTRS